MRTPPPRICIAALALVVALTACGTSSAAPTAASSKQAATCLAKQAKVETSPIKQTPASYRFGLVARTVSGEFEDGNTVELWFYSSPDRAREVLSTAKIFAKQFHTTVGTIGSVLYTWNPKPTSAQSKLLKRCLA